MPASFTTLRPLFVVGLEKAPRSRAGVPPDRLARLPPAKRALTSGIPQDFRDFRVEPVDQIRGRRRRRENAPPLARLESRHRLGDGRHVLERFHAFLARHGERTQAPGAHVRSAVGTAVNSAATCARHQIDQRRAARLCTVRASCSTPRRSLKSSPVRWLSVPLPFEA